MRPAPRSPLFPAAIRQLRIMRCDADPLDRRAGEHLAEGGIVQREQVAPAAARPARRAAGRRGWRRPHRRTGSTGTPPGNRRSRRCGCRSPRGTRPGSARHARSSGRRCSAAHRSGAARGTPRSGRRRGSALHSRNARLRRPARRASSSRLVRITPRNSQLPCSRLTRLVCLPCQPIPAAWASGFSITGAVSTNTLSSRRRALDDEAGERLQRLLDRLVIVAALGIDRDAPALGPLGQRQRVRSPARSSCRARSPIWPRATARAATRAGRRALSIQPIVP